MSKVKLTMNELFSGIGAQKRGIDLTGLFDCEVVTTSDIDKDAMLSYAAIHKGLTTELINTYDEYPTKEEMAELLTVRNIGYDFKKNLPYNWNKHIKQKNKILETNYLACVLTDNLGDISLISKLPYADLWTYSFPCQDISIAGKQKGFKKGSGTRSGLLWEVERLLIKSKESKELPKYLLLENVKALVNQKNIDDFNDWLEELNELGYNTYWQVVNGKNCGVPQNRERTFAISIRKDINTGLFEFMKPFDNGIRLKDILEDEVDEKYYISDDKISKILNSEFMQKKLRIQFGDTTCGCLLARDYKDPKCVPVRIGNIYGENVGAGYAGNVWDKEAICPTLMTMQGGNRQPMVLDETEKVGIDKSYNKPKTIDNANCITTREDRGVSNRKSEGTAQRCDKGIRFFKDNVCGTLRTIDSCGDKRVLELLNSVYRIRKLTPKECFRLMGFEDEDVEKCINLGTSNSQLYKEAGNSIITYCIKLIAEHLYKAQYDSTYICTDERMLNERNRSINFTQPQSV